MLPFAAKREQSELLETGSRHIAIADYKFQSVVIFATRTRRCACTKDFSTVAACCTCFAVVSGLPQIGFDRFLESHRFEIGQGQVRGDLFRLRHAVVPAGAGEYRGSQYSEEQAFRRFFQGVCF